VGNSRPTVLIDACSLAGALRRNLLLTLAEAGLFRVRWSQPILGETERAVAAMLRSRGDPDCSGRAAVAVASMIDAFPEAMVSDFDRQMRRCGELPDPADAHVLAAASKARATIIVTENTRHFPVRLVSRFGIETRTTDTFIAETVTLDVDQSVAALKSMRLRFRRPELSPDLLLSRLADAGMVRTGLLLQSCRDLL
jgi:predicted nucleic acid-binding protein